MNILTGVDTAMRKVSDSLPERFLTRGGLAVRKSSISLLSIEQTPQSGNMDFPASGERLTGREFFKLLFE